jgi:hypothetical protein
MKTEHKEYRAIMLEKATAEKLKEIKRGGQTMTELVEAMLSLLKKLGKNYIR